MYLRHITPRKNSSQMPDKTKTRNAYTKTNTEVDDNHGKLYMQHELVK